MKHHAAAFAVQSQRRPNILHIPLLTHDSREGCVDKVWVFVDARLALRVALIGKKLQVIVVFLFASIIQLLESLHVQVEVVASEI